MSAADGPLAGLTVLSDQHWLDLCDAMQRPDLRAVERWHGVAVTPPALGADTDAVLGERLGLSAADLAALRAAGVV